MTTPLTCKHLKDGNGEGGAGEHDVQPEKAILAAVKVDVDVVLRVPADMKGTHVHMHEADAQQAAGSG